MCGLRGQTGCAGADGGGGGCGRGFLEGGVGAESGEEVGEEGTVGGHFLL